MNRRRFLLGGIALAAAGGLWWSRSSAVDLSNLGSRAVLKMPPLIDATQTRSFDLTAQSGKTEFWKGKPSPTLGFNQDYLGPVIRLASGEVQGSVTNRANRPVSAHWHGLLVPGNVDGGPHFPVLPGETWRPELNIDQRSATAWYHTHIHGETATGVYAGLAGGIIVSDGRDSDRGLPSSYGEDDLFLVLQDKQFSEDSRLIYPRNMMSLMHGFTADTMMVNGQIGAVAKVPRGIVRLRLLNGCNARIFRLELSDGRPMHLVATDGGYLQQPLSLSQLRLAPGERAEVLVDFSNEKPVALTSLRDPNAGMGGMMGRFQRFGAEVLGGAFEVLTFVPRSEKGEIDRIPEKLDGEKPRPVSEASITRSRSFSLDMGMGGGMMGGGMMRGGMMGSFAAINGQPFDMNRLDLTTKLGTMEKWTITSNMLAHPFHIHGVLFTVLSENGGKPRPENSGLKDTVLVENEAEILIEFTKPATQNNPFMYHCHILEHEDGGMMGQFAVV